MIYQQTEDTNRTANFIAYLYNQNLLEYIQPNQLKGLTTKVNWQSSEDANQHLKCVKIFLGSEVYTKPEDLNIVNDLMDKYQKAISNINSNLTEQEAYKYLTAVEEWTNKWAVNNPSDEWTDIDNKYWLAC